MLQRLLKRPVPQFTVPHMLARLASLLPQQPPTLALATALNLALGRLLPRESLEPLLGRCVLIDVSDAGLALRLALTPRGFMPAAAGAPVALTIRAGARDLLALALRQEDADTLFFGRRLLMEGDTELGLLVKNTLDAVDWDALDLALLAPPRVFSALRAARPA